MLHVMRPIDGIVWTDVPLAYESPFPEYIAGMRERLESFLADDFRGIHVTRVVEEGDPARKIVEFAHAQGTRLIVMPTHGYGPFRRFLLGSVTAKVLHDADCPVLTGVHMENPPASVEGMPQNILCAVDLGPQMEKVLSWAADAASALNSRLTVVHALPKPDAGEARYFDQEWRWALADEAKQRIKRCIGIETDRDLILENGEVPGVIHRAAESVKAGLVVIGRHAGSGILGRLRDHGYAIIRESPCPVISV